MELGPAMPPPQFCISDPGREFICFTRGLIFEGNVLAYDPSTNGVEWIPVHDTASILSWVEEMSALVLCNMVLCVTDEGAGRLNRFRECREENERDCKEEVEEQTMDEDNREEEGYEDVDDEDADDEDMDDEDGDKESESHSSSGSMQESPRSTHHYSDRHHHCPHSWAE